MSAGVYHILNGDSLKEQFPEGIKGEIIVARECLVDGEVKAGSIEELYQIRAKFISDNYPGSSKEEYYKKVVPEIEKIRNLPSGAVVNLWFEEDLFCQVNLWFVISLLYQSEYRYDISLVMPEPGNIYGFGGMNTEKLVNAFNKRTKVGRSDLAHLSQFWGFYQTSSVDELLGLAQNLDQTYPFLLPAIEAYEDSIPTNGNPGRPVNTLLAIMSELKTKEFAPVFREFCKREHIYGYGDLQVKRIFDRIVDSQA